MPCSAKFSMTLNTDILSTETSDFLKKIIFLKSFNSVLFMVGTILKIEISLELKNYAEVQIKYTIDDNFKINLQNFQNKMFRPHCIILRIQRLYGKQCGSR